MQSIVKYAAPNVVPGTNFNTQRFHEMYAWISGLTADATRSTLGPYQHGLLIAYDGRASLKLKKTEGLLVLNRCVGMSPAGRVIALFEDVTTALETHLKDYDLDSQEAYYVMIEIHGTKRIAFGPISEELPERPQFSMPACRLHIQPVKQQSGAWADAFPVGRLQYEIGEWKLIDYIPPVAQIGAHELIREKYRDHKEATKVILDSLPSIIRQTDSFRDKSMLELREFCIQCGSFLAARQKAMDALTESGQPFQLLENWMAFANLMRFLLNCLSDKPGFYNLLYQNTRSVNGVMLTTERLDKALSDLAEHTYDHHNILQTVKSVDEFLALVVPMFKALGNGTLRPGSNRYEGVVEAPKVDPKQSYITW